MAWKAWRAPLIVLVAILGLGLWIVDGDNKSSVPWTGLTLILNTPVEMQLLTSEKPPTRIEVDCMGGMGAVGATPSKVFSPRPQTQYRISCRDIEGNAYVEEVPN